jgi:hypothetical protein
MTPKNRMKPILLIENPIFFIKIGINGSMMTDDIPKTNIEIRA